ncbi:NAD(P)H-dependent oxidoreductase [Marinomonas epiphytica]
MTHAIISDLKNRYTTKRYDETKRVSKEDLEVIYEAIRLSASSINSQPWKFVVIESEAAKERLHSTFANKFQFNQPHIKSASHTILFAHKTHYDRADYEKVIDADIRNGRTLAENKEHAFGAFAFAQLNTDGQGVTSPWTKAQTYLALGNAMHAIARLGIDSTPMEGIDTELVAKEFAEELAGYQCDVALAIGYKKEEEDYNLALPKSRLALSDVLQVL